MQVTVLAQGLDAVNALHRQLRAQIEHFSARQAGASRILSCVFAGHGPADFDQITGISSKPADYLISYR